MKPDRVHPRSNEMQRQCPECESEPGTWFWHGRGNSDTNVVTCRRCRACFLTAIHAPRY